MQSKKKREKEKLDPIFTFKIISFPLHSKKILNGFSLYLNANFLYKNSFL